MRDYSYTEKWKKLLTPEIVVRLTKLHEYKVLQNQFIEGRADTLIQLVEIAKIQSTEASNKIEGISTSGDRLNKILKDKTMPKNRSEKEIAGYRDVLATVHENHDYIPVKPNMITQLHQMLYKYSGSSMGGRFKSTDNIIEERTESGERFIRFIPVPAWETAESVDGLCQAFDETVRCDDIDPLIIIPMFILDFLCIHPFNDGNGRMSRLLTLLLLYRAGYSVGKYISLEKIIEQSKETYYDTLQQSSYNWHENANDYSPFVSYTLGIILAAYKEFLSRVQLVAEKGLSKPERVREIIREKIGKITKTEIMTMCPDISQVTVQRALNDLTTSGEIIKIGDGRYTSYMWNHDKV